MHEDTKTFEQGSNSVDFNVPYYGPSGHVNVYVYGPGDVHSYYEWDPDKSSDFYILYQDDGSGLTEVGVTDIPIGSIDVIMVW